MHCRHLGRLFGVGLFLALPAAANPSTQAPLCAASAQEAEQARALMQAGLQQAIKEHTAHLFRTWLSTGIEGRENAARGLRREIAGFLYAQHVIDEWQIPLCQK